MSNPTMTLGAQIANMSANNQNEMSLRDWFAGMALQGMLSNPDAIEQIYSEDNDSSAAASKASYLLADAMLKARQS